MEAAVKGRAEEFKNIAGEQFDLCVIGGGATGSACALDAQFSEFELCFWRRVTLRARRPVRRRRSYMAESGTSKKLLRGLIFRSTTSWCGHCTNVCGCWKTHRISPGRWNS